MATPPAPGFTKEQVEYLERVFPNRAPAFADTNRQVWAAVGKVEVVNHIRALYNQQVQRELKR